MSKIGIKPIALPTTVQLTVGVNEAVIKGPQGEIKVVIPANIRIVIKDAVATVERTSEEKKFKALHGLVRSLVANAVVGVEKPWEKTLEIQGVGYKVAQEGTKLVFKVGFSHPVNFVTPTDVTAEVKGNKIILRGIDKQRVGEVAAKVKSIKKPDKYKGKGIRYAGEVIKLKPGKKAKAGA